MNVRKIISGMQTGADEGGVKAGKALGLQTGGTMPKTFRTLDGPKPEYKDLYGIIEHSEYSYVPRTGENVKNSDGTVRFAGNFNSNGEKCTLRFIRQYQKPYFDVSFQNPPPIDEFRKWLKEKDIKTLNVAGNSEQTWTGIEKFTFDYLFEALLDYNEVR